MFAYSWHQTDDETKNWSKSKESLRIYGITDDGKHNLFLLLMILNHLFILNYHHQLIGDQK